MPTAAAPSVPASRQSRARSLEIADAPIARAAQAVKLGGEAPAARAGLQTIREVTRIRRDDEADFRGHAGAADGEAMIAERQLWRQAQLGRLAPAGALGSVFEPALPFDAAALRR